MPLTMFRGAAIRRVREIISLRRRRTWRTGAIDVTYTYDLDGGGSFSADDYARVIRKYMTGPFERGYEWCSGPGFIGYAMLAAGIARAFCFADINPRAIDCVRRTASRNRLGKRVASYVSDNLDSVPAEEMFDLVVANPPSYCGLNPQHPLYDRYKDDLRPNDPGWRIHRRFFATIAPHLRHGALMFIAEVQIDSLEVRTPGVAEAYDIRERPPIDDFREMIAAAGLELVAVEPLAVLPGGFDCQVMVIRKQ